MTPDRDTLARDLLTLPALVGAPREVVRGLCLRDEAGRERTVGRTKRYRNGPIIWDFGPIDYTPDQIHAAGWRVDLDAPATAGVLVAVYARAIVPRGHDPSVRRALADVLDVYDDLSLAGTPTLAEAAARALLEAHDG